MSRNENIQVFIRIRPNGCKRSSIDLISDREISVRDKCGKKSLTFAGVFDPTSNQNVIYETAARPLVKDTLSGYNCTLFAYGQSGSGKTFTMLGEKSSGDNLSWENDRHAGLIPRSLNQIFDEIDKMGNDVFVQISSVLIYNEELYDLLPSNDETKLRIYDDASGKGSIVISGLEDVIVRSKNEAFNCMDRVFSKKEMLTSSLNACSSRVHTIFTISVTVKENSIPGEEFVRHGKLCLVDLGGNSNSKGTNSDKAGWDSSRVNLSLLTFGRVINSLFTHKSHVPYRESKLTRLLRDSLGGSSKTCIVACIKPFASDIDETVSTLDVMNKAKMVANQPEINKKATVEDLVKKFSSEIVRLRKDLDANKSETGFFVDHDNYREMEKKLLMSQNSILELQKKHFEHQKKIFDLQKEKSVSEKIARENEVKVILHCSERITNFQSEILGNLNANKENLEEFINKEVESIFADRTLENKFGEHQLKLKNLEETIQSSLVDVSESLDVRKANLTDLVTKSKLEVTQMIQNVLISEMDKITSLIAKSNMKLEESGKQITNNNELQDKLQEHLNDPGMKTLMMNDLNIAKTIDENETTKVAADVAFTKLMEKLDENIEMMNEFRLGFSEQSKGVTEQLKKGLEKQKKNFSKLSSAIETVKSQDRSCLRLVNEEVSLFRNNLTSSLNEATDVLKKTDVTVETTKLKKTIDARCNENKENISTHLTKIKQHSKLSSEKSEMIKCNLKDQLRLHDSIFGQELTSYKATGETPHRQEYRFPEKLAGLSPYERSRRSLQINEDDLTE